MTQTSYLKNTRRIAIVAYPDTRKELIEWSYLNKNVLKNHMIISTARTAAILEGSINTPVLNLDHGKSGGYNQIKELIENGTVDMLIFFGNPLLHQHNDTWFKELVNTAIRQEIVVGYNQATIDMLLASLTMEQNEPALN